MISSPDARAVEAAKKALADARERLRENSGLLLRLSVFLDRWVQANFRGQGSKVGGWEPFKYGGRATSKRKANAATTGKPRVWINTTAKLLQDTGHLRLSFRPFVEGGSAGIGSDLPYAQAHEHGLPARGLVARRMLPRHSEVWPDAQEIIEGWVRVRLGGRAT